MWVWAEEAFSLVLLRLQEDKFIFSLAIKMKYKSEISNLNNY